LIIKDGKLLAVKNADHPGLFYCVGGRMRINETSEAAVVRESYEETGCKLEIDRIRFVEESMFNIGETKYHLVAFHYLMKGCPRLDIKDGKSTDQGAIETLHWLPLDNLDKFELMPTFLRHKQLDGAGLEHIITSN